MVTLLGPVQFYLRLNLSVFYCICIEPEQNQGRGLWPCKTGLSPQVIYY